MANSTIQVIVRIVALSVKEEAVRTLLLQLIEPTRQEKGCIRYELLQNHAEPTEFVFTEEWENEVALMVHLDGYQFKAGQLSAQVFQLLSDRVRATAIFVI